MILRAGLDSHDPFLDATPPPNQLQDQARPWMSYMIPGYVGDADRLFEPHNLAHRKIHDIPSPTDTKVTQVVLSLLDSESGTTFEDLMQVLGACNVCGRIFGFNTFPYHSCIRDMLMAATTLTSFSLPRFTMPAFSSTTSQSCSSSSTQSKENHAPLSSPSPNRLPVPFPPISPLALLPSPLPSPLPSTPPMSTSSTTIKKEPPSDSKLKRRLEVKQEVEDGNISLLDLTESDDD
ncbi:hypothetical protein PHLCEN_2v10497 [Hermanssonia centrifuga]|uniref:Uncharacterized protein n=1 Tax=Hermanssonia centrifuga TaxID=98765 RepID=A0A2R6NMG8_9APHY|nr:hypothetical protein PHLCEN_2v10497 [Hermanssonia centrifuga]